MAQPHGARGKQMDKEKQAQMRWFLTDKVRRIVNWHHTDQFKGVEAPPIQKPAEENRKTIELPAIVKSPGLEDIPLSKAISQRKSRRAFMEKPLSMDELAFLLWAVQGIRNPKGPNAKSNIRTVPSAGGRHPFETYIAVLNVDGLAQGIYRYLPIDHCLVQLRLDENLGESLIDAALGQVFCGRSAATFIWSVIPYRTEWRYDLAAYRVILMDAGHLCQNLYLACEGINAGTCAVGAYDQEAMDTLINVDGKDEFTIYMAPVGKL